MWTGSGRWRGHVSVGARRLQVDLGDARALSEEAARAALLALRAEARVAARGGTGDGSGVGRGPASGAAAPIRVLPRDRPIRIGDLVNFYEGAREDEIRTAAANARLARSVFAPLLGRAVDRVFDDELAALVMARAKTARASARQAQSVLRKASKMAWSFGRIPHPFACGPMIQKRERHRVLPDAMVGRLCRAAWSREGRTQVETAQDLAFLVMACGALRWREAAELHEDELDAERGLVILAGDRNKTGALSAFPIGPFARRVIGRARAETMGRGLFFSPLADASERTARRARGRLYLAAGAEDVVTSDLRRWAATRLTKEGFGSDIADAALNHKTPAGRSRSSTPYLRDPQLERRREAILVIDRIVEAWATGGGDG